MKDVILDLWYAGAQGSLLILLILAARRVLRKYSRGYTYILWALVGLCLLCPVRAEIPGAVLPDRTSLLPDITSVLSAAFGMQGSEEDLDSPSAAEEIFLPREMREAGIPAGSALDSLALDNLDSLAPNSSALKGTFQAADIAAMDIVPALQILYMIGLSAAACIHLFQYAAIRKRVSTAVREQDNIWLCDQISGAFVMGVIRPRIYLPYDLPEKDRAYILQHEQAHIRHHDPVIRILSSFCLCLHWWNPLVWLAVRRMNQDMEMFCDESVLEGASLSERKTYADLLLAYAASGSAAAGNPAFGACIAAVRIKSALHARRKSRVLLCVEIAVAVLCGMIFMTVRANAGAGEGSVYGTWSATGEYFTSRVCALSGEEIDVLAQAEVRYESDSFSTGIPSHPAAVYRIQGYGEQVITEEDLRKEYRLGSRNLKILDVSLGDTMRFLTAQGDISAWGDSFCLLGADRGLVYWRGVFFEVARSFP